MLTLNSNILKIGNKWLLPVESGGVVPPAPTVYQVTTSATHGTVTANPTEGTTGTEVTLSNTPDTHYHFGSYSLTGATLKNANQFDIADSDVSVVGNFIEDTKYSVTCTNDGNGTIAASPTSNYSGSTVTLSNTPNSGYDFDKYTLVSGTGASISGNILTIGTSNVTVRGNFAQADPYNPLNLPANTVRVRTNDGNPPSTAYSPSYETATLVSGTTNVYDVYKSGTDFDRLLYKASNVAEVLGANTTGIRTMAEMFTNCVSLTSVSLFNTSSVTTMSYMFDNCESLTAVPLFDTSRVTTMDYAFNYCLYVESGALALYQQVSSQAWPPSSHIRTFYLCGANTTTGAAELAQIPTAWGGRGA